MPTATREQDGRRVLVIEDDASARTALQELLSAAGYRVEVASSMAEALSKLSCFEAEVILTDLDLADGRGAALVRRLRDAVSEVPIIVMSAHAVPRAARGVDGSLTKPLHLDEIVEVIRNSRRDHPAPHASAAR